MLATTWGTGQVLLSMIWFTLFFIWIWLLVIVFADIFRSHDMGGWHKALWVIFVIIVPYLGVFVYLIARGGSMGKRAAEQQQRAQQHFDAAVKEAAGSSGVASPGALGVPAEATVGVPAGGCWAVSARASAIDSKVLLSWAA